MKVKLQNTNTKAFKSRMFAYLLASTYDMDELSDSDKAREILRNFEHAANYPNNIKRIPNATDRVSDWLQGVPLNIAIYNYDIITTVEQLHELPAGSIDRDSKQADELIENWFKFCAFKLMQLWHSHGLSIPN